MEGADSCAIVYCGACVTIDTGDEVLHVPTGEHWIVACVYGEYLSWCGWPEGFADLSDCTLVRKATPEQRVKLLQEMAAMRSDDHRKHYARHILGLMP